MNENEMNQKFREDIRSLIVEWYSACPQSMKFVSNTIKTYKNTFPDDNFMKDINHDI